MRMKATGTRRARSIAAAATVSTHADRHGPGCFFSEGQQRVALGTAQTAPGMLAEKKDDKGKNQTQTDRDGKWDNGHGESTGCGRKRSGGGVDLGSSTVAATVVKQQFLSSEPVVEFDSFATAAFHPKVIGNLLDFSLGRLAMRSEAGANFLHGSGG